MTTQLHDRPNVRQSPWFDVLGNSTSGRSHLLCFPYAGGGTQIFQSWREFLPPDITLYLAQLPGRSKRFTEPPFTCLRDLVRTLASAVSPVLPEPFALIGHSMGAVISFELARELRRTGRLLPRALFVSGRSAPQLPRSNSPAFDLPDTELIGELKRLDGTPRQLLDSPGAMSTFLPVIRADLQMIQTHEYLDEDPLPSPIYAYGGLQDQHTSPAGIRAWQQQTTAKFTVRMFPGSHFFIHTSSANVTHILKRDLQQVFAAG